LHSNHGGPLRGNDGKRGDGIKLKKFSECWELTKSNGNVGR